MRNISGQFQKGFPPWNKNMKGIHLSSTSEFKKGCIPWNRGSKGLCQPNKTSFKIGHEWSEEIEQRRLKNSISKIIIKPNLSSTNELSYLLGLIYGDGFVSKNKRNSGYIIGFDNTRKPVVDEAMKLFKSIGLNPNLQIIKPYNGISKKDRYRVSCYSKQFYEFYKKIDLNILKNLLNDRTKIILFIRGFYEAEGTIYKSKKNQYCIRIVNTNIELLNLIKTHLKQLDLIFNLYGPKKPKGFGKKDYYTLETSKKEQVIRFFNLINPCIKRLKI